MSDERDLCQCQTGTCGYIYDSKKGDKKGNVEKGTRWDDLPDDWVCPCCGVGKKMFKNMTTGD